MGFCLYRVCLVSRNHFE